MEKVKFRAWDEKKKEMIHEFSGHDCHADYGELTISNQDNHNDYYELELMQFTGLTDKNEVEAYDQDIYKNGESGLIGLFHIEESIGGYILFCTEYKNGQIHTHIPFIELNLTDFEVIGNIHQDKHLLD
jgi:uncharacterized phage protein (TIGR01671 family)